MAEWKDAALGVLRSRGRIRVLELAAELRVGMRAARGLVNSLLSEKLIGPEDSEGWHYPSAATRPGPESQKPAPSDAPATSHERIAELEEQVKRLKEAGRVVIAQRDEWKARAQALEQHRVPLGTQARDRRFDELKRLLARELHPDQTQGSGVDKLIREAIFKRLWPLVEEIERKPAQSR